MPSNQTLVKVICGSPSTLLALHEDPDDLRAWHFSKMSFGVAQNTLRDFIGMCELKITNNKKYKARRGTKGESSIENDREEMEGCPFLRDGPSSNLTLLKLICAGSPSTPLAVHEHADDLRARHFAKMSSGVAHNTLRNFRGICELKN